MEWKVLEIQHQQVRGTGALSDSKWTNVLVVGVLVFIKALLNLMLEMVIWNNSNYFSAGTNASNIGKFEYDVPTGYTALSTKGLNL